LLTAKSSYRELDERSSRLAQALMAAGVEPGDRVAHLDRTGIEVIECGRGAPRGSGGCS
jgi:long-chain acyl-CoA synthetase